MANRKFQIEDGTVTIWKQGKSPEDEVPFFYRFKYDAKNWRNREFIRFFVNGMADLADFLSSLESGREFLEQLGDGFLRKGNSFSLPAVPTDVTDILFIEGARSFFPGGGVDPRIVRPPVNLFVLRKRLPEGE